MLAVSSPNCAHTMEGRMESGRTDRLRHLTFDALDLTGSEAGEGALVLGSRDSSRPHGALNVDNGSSSGGATLPEGKTLSGHLGGVCRSQLGVGNSRTALLFARQEDVGENRARKMEESTKASTPRDKTSK